jgi:hypothetical protein
MTWRVTIMKGEESESQQTEKLKTENRELKTEN